MQVLGSSGLIDSVMDMLIRASGGLDNLYSWLETFHSKLDTMRGDVSTIEAWNNILEVARFWACMLRAQRGTTLSVYAAGTEGRTLSARISRDCGCAAPCMACRFTVALQQLSSEPSSPSMSANLATLPSPDSHTCCRFNRPTTTSSSTRSPSCSGPPP